MARVPKNATPCIDSGRHHAWESTGLDVVEDNSALVSTGRCAWCGVRAARPYYGPSSPGIRPGVRIRPF